MLVIVMQAKPDGLEQLAQQMAGDVNLQDIARQAEVVTGLGISASDAGVLIATLIVAMRLIDANRGLFITINDWVRRRLNLGPMHPPPGPPHHKP